MIDWFSLFMIIFIVSIVFALAYFEDQPDEN
jgi:hypothetical protein